MVPVRTRATGTVHCSQNDAVLASSVLGCLCFCCNVDSLDTNEEKPQHTRGGHFLLAAAISGECSETNSTQLTNGRVSIVSCMGMTADTRTNVNISFSPVPVKAEHSAYPAMFTVFFTRFATASPCSEVTGFAPDAARRSTTSSSKRRSFLVPQMMT